MNRPNNIFEIKNSNKKYSQYKANIFKEPSYTALELSKYIISKCNLDGNPISNYHVQAILFILKEKFKEKDITIFYDEFEKRAFGYIIPNIYYYYCGYGVLPIMANYRIDIVDEENKIIIDRVIEEICQLDFLELAEKMKLYYTEYEINKRIK